ncbi:MULTISPECIES: fatty acid--CoA ligase FadD10 [Mycobacterium]|uniref:fatty acid--CoA ligase FadD10 n=1 Tax=Mycobacterium TaxID=1763 RepID=UPI001EEFC570|nr:MULTISPECIES: fatty acid--CoA ligase FadD10 [Mycobacterium]BDB41156.1 putative fatty-acid--CoA ligase FadD10 [Mycobacterium kiyosense]BDE12943.1 putative fatty-acid--CoA ligase FadD10 [Mycobacterium sp. 20KCMC460]GLB91535.1 putative fatty-acid--CoA ligase FadD10 [Mycobacterium kiyosense]GLC04001.1 putative fatty-acid--CoA ligase FadD10 [Mycobacterium kiyosense]GLC09995.1 putative fatty-acid--CoA ligase FadD10 [Mycobacterium kiyosense]
MSQLAPTVLQRVRDQARLRPEAIALRRVDGTAVLRYGTLFTELERYAETLASQGVSRGHRVLVVSDNGPQTYLSVLTCARLGAIAVMVDANLPPATITRFAEITGPTAVLATPGARDMPDALADLPTVAVETGSASSGDFADVDYPDLGAEDPLAMIFTSGTTGEPKAVLLANRTFYAIPDILRNEGLNWISWVDGETTYSPLPATHIGGLWWILTCLIRGGCCITGGENTTSLLQILASNAVASTCLVPTLLAKLVSELKANDATLPSLRLLGYGGSRAIAADVRFVEATGVRTAQVYGLSETGCTALCLPTDDGSITRIEAGAVGRPYPGVEVYLAADGERPPSFGAADSASFGTLWIKSPANMLGYWNNPDRTAEVLSDGWVNTGDLLERHDDGFFYIKGRSSEMIICGGVNVAPDEVDRIAECVPGVREAACYEIPDAEFGALVGLAVVPAAACDEAGRRQLQQAIAARFRQESEAAARPSTIVLVSDIPRTQSGKVMRTSLAAKVIDAPVGAMARG